ncbi:hypothetical protein FDY95_25600 [Hymenobacter jeollabukensis]|uniref:Uncharacterized protein n=1 Tax=Hymenobacter jeollabukensis TaxID=2025313 RepID=A0A5R8WI43_9BACT|nr:hypothetical protein FDY95_25600 [Hymenobacter jeollabukensis]
MLNTLALFACQAQTATPTDSSKQRFARVLAKRNKLIDTKFEQAAAKRQLRRVFRRFYRDDSGQFYRGQFELSDSDPESDKAGFVVFIKCPTLDPSTYHDVDSSNYSADKNGVYYFCFSGHNTLFVIVPGADPLTFRALPGLEVGYDTQHVFLGANQVPTLRPTALRVYAGPENSAVPCGSNDMYLTDGLVVLKNEKLTQVPVRAFRAPKGYKLAYPLRSSNQPTKR